ncbi:MAG: Ig-like domain-containing protein [Bacteroidota bacterium]
MPDTEAPTVKIISPSTRIIANSINVIAKSNDNVAVAGVQFLLNGSELGAEDMNSPYSFSWNTATVANGNYILTARSRDAAGNITTSSR